MQSGLASSGLLCCARVSGSGICSALSGLNEYGGQRTWGCAATALRFALHPGLSCGTLSACGAMDGWIDFGVRRIGRMCRFWRTPRTGVPTSACGAADGIADFGVRPGKLYVRTGWVAARTGKIDLQNRSGDGYRPVRRPPAAVPRGMILTERRFSSIVLTGISCDRRIARSLEQIARHRWFFLGATRVRRIQAFPTE